MGREDYQEISWLLSHVSKPGVYLPNGSKHQRPYNLFQLIPFYQSTTT